MAERNFHEITQAHYAQQRHVCMGVDTNFNVVKALAAKDQIKLANYGNGCPTYESELVLAFNKKLFETADETGLVAVVKPNVAFYRRLGRGGFWAMEQTRNLHRQILPNSALLWDAKVQDIDSTNEGYDEELFTLLEGDGITVHPFLGYEAIRSTFLDRKDKGIFVLSRTSNRGAGEFQDLYVTIDNRLPPQVMLYQYVAGRVAKHWNDNGNCGIVAGATYPDQSKIIREIVGPHIPILFPGVGAQGGEAKDVTVRALRKGEYGFINSSRGISFPKLQEGETHWEGVKRAITELHDEIVTAQNQ